MVAGMRGRLRSAAGAVRGVEAKRRKVGGEASRKRFSEAGRGAERKAELQDESEKPDPCRKEAPPAVGRGGRAPQFGSCQIGSCHVITIAARPPTRDRAAHA